MLTPAQGPEYKLGKRFELMVKNTVPGLLNLFVKCNIFFGLKSSFLKIENFFDCSLQFPPNSQAQHFILPKANAFIFYPQTH